MNLTVADRDGNGTKELYVAGTNNFFPDRRGEESSPMVLAVEADWNASPIEVNLFKPGRTLASEVPSGVRLVYVDLRRFRHPQTSEWEYALIASSTMDKHGPFLQVRMSGVRGNLVGSEAHLLFIRLAVFDRSMRVVNTVWVNKAVRALGIDTDAWDPALQPRYWSGTTWQEEVCYVPEEAEWLQPARPRIGIAE
jgi:hypothetical protein